MKLYVKTILYGILGIVIFNLIMDFRILTVVNVFKCVAISCFPSIIISLVVKLLPKNIFTPNNPLFKVFKFENRILTFLGVKNWKDKIPDAGAYLDKFSKRNLSEPRNKEYIDKFITQSIYAESIHNLSILWGVISLKFFSKNIRYKIGVPVVVLNTFLHGLPVLVQRYLRPKLLKISSRLSRAQVQIIELNTTENQEKKE